MPVQVRGEVLSNRKVGVVLPAHPRRPRHRGADPPGTLRGARRRRAGHLDAAAPLPSRSTGPRARCLRRDGRHRLRDPRPRDGVARRTARARPGRRRRAARQAVRPPTRARDRDARRRRLRLCTAVRSRRAAARPRVARRLRSRGVHREKLFGALDAKRMLHAGRDHHRGRVARASADASPTCCPGCSRATSPTSSTRAARWRCCPRSRTSRGDYGAHSQCAVEEAMACGIGVCMTCVLPVVGDDGRDPDGAVVRRGAGLRR